MDYRKVNMINLVLNLLWFILGGVVMGLGWWLSGVIMVITVVGIPWAKACFVIGNFAFWPFGRRIVSREVVTGQTDIGTGALGTIGNVVWIVLAGIWLAIGHVVAAVSLFITLIGIPFGLQHLKLAGVTLAPIGKTIVDNS